MNKIKWFILAGLLFTTAGAFAQTPPSADQVVREARHQASVTHRKVFLMFHASWCGWCRRMDSLMASPSLKGSFDANYVIAHLVIMEMGPKKSLDNPGALELYNKYAGGDSQGIPFWLIIDSTGTVLADSRIKAEGAAPGSTGNNTGCPDKPEEMTYFVHVLKETSAMTADQLQSINDQFPRHH